MSGTDQSSLISFLAAPVLVVDPEGHIIYANPAFGSRFVEGDLDLQGEDLASVFEGGGREAILGAVAKVCESGGEVRFRLREGGRGYLAVASSIESADNRVGVMILLTDEPKSDDRLATIHSQIQEPLEEVQAILDEMIEQTGGRRSAAYRTLVERAMVAVERVSKWSDELQGVLTGRSPSQSSVIPDPARAVRGALSVVANEFEAEGVTLDLLLPPQICSVRGDEAILTTALLQLLRHRLNDVGQGGRITLTARTFADGSRTGVLFSVVDVPNPQNAAAGSEPVPALTPKVVREAVITLGGSIHTAVEPALGRVTAIELEASA